MSCIVYQKDPKSGAKYAYESISFWDKEKKQPRSTRRYLGRVDEETGEIIKKKDRSPRREESRRSELSEIANLKKKIKEKDKVIANLRTEIADKEKAYNKLMAAVRKADKLIRTVLSENQVNI